MGPGSSPTRAMGSECGTDSDPYDSDRWSCTSGVEDVYEREWPAVAFEASTCDQSPCMAPFDLQSAQRLGVDHAKVDKSERAKMFVATRTTLTRLFYGRAVSNPIPRHRGD